MLNCCKNRRTRNYFYYSCKPTCREKKNTVEKIKKHLEKIKPGSHCRKNQSGALRKIEKNARKIFSARARGARRGCFSAPLHMGRAPTSVYRLKNFLRALGARVSCLGLLLGRRVCGCGSYPHNARPRLAAWPASLSQKFSFSARCARSEVSCQRSPHMGRAPPSVCRLKNFLRALAARAARLPLSVPRTWGAPPSFACRLRNSRCAHGAVAPKRSQHMWRAPTPVCPLKISSARCARSAVASQHSPRMGRAPISICPLKNLLRALRARHCYRCRLLGHGVCRLGSSAPDAARVRLVGCVARFSKKFPPRAARAARLLLRVPHT